MREEIADVEIARFKEGQYYEREINGKVGGGARRATLLSCLSQPFVALPARATDRSRTCTRFQSTHE